MKNVKLKDFFGEPRVYNNVPKIFLEAAESTEENPILVPYTYGESVSKTIDPVFSGGDMSLDFSLGELVTSLMITKPTNLIPENIRAGITIAGILGNLVAESETGALKTRSGTIVIPERQNVLQEYFVDGEDGAIKNFQNYWIKTSAPARFVPQQNQQYFGSYGPYKSEATAEYRESFLNYGACITLGNCFLATGDPKDNTFEMWLYIYQPSENTGTVFVAGSPADYEDIYGDIRSLYMLEICNRKASAETVSVVHGENTKPDFVFVYLKTPGNDFDVYPSYVWGMKAEKSRDGIVSGLCCQSIPAISKEYALDHTSNPYLYLYCPNETTFAMDPEAEIDLQMCPGAAYGWVAFWGVKSE